MKSMFTNYPSDNLQKIKTNGHDMHFPLITPQLLTHYHPEVPVCSYNPAPYLVETHFKYTTIGVYPDELCADVLLKSYFPDYICPDERFMKILVFVCYFYYDLIYLPNQLGHAANRWYYYFLGNVQTKRLRFAIAGDAAMRDQVLYLGYSDLGYLNEDFYDFKDKMEVIHKIALHIAVLRSDTADRSESFALLTVDDPLIYLFAVLYEQGDLKC